MTEDEKTLEPETGAAGTEAPQDELARKIEVVRRVDLFLELDDDEVEAVARAMTPVTFRSGEEVMKEGEVGHSMYVLAEGEVMVNRTLTMKFGQDDFRETEKTLVILSSNNTPVFGEMALVTDLPRTATITTRTDCMVYEIRRSQFMQLAEENPSLGFKAFLQIAALLAHRLKKSSDDVIRLTTALSIALSH